MSEKLLSTAEVAALLTSMSRPDDSWDERRAWRWMRRATPETGEQPGFRVKGKWYTTLDRLREAFPREYDDAEARAADRALDEAEQAPDCECCDRLRAQLANVERLLAEAHERAVR